MVDVQKVTEVFNTNDKKGQKKEKHKIKPIKENDT